VILQPDGKLIAGGHKLNLLSGDDDFALARYNPDGRLDSHFGSGGTVTTDFGGDETIAGLVLQPDGRIVAAGRITLTFLSQTNFALARYNSDGSLDASFGAQGFVSTDFNGNADEAWAAVLQPDGKIVAAGSADNGAVPKSALARYNPDGAIDPTFGSGGRVLTDFGDVSLISALALQPDGKLVAAGADFDRGIEAFNFALSCYNPDGSLDVSFGSGGKISATDFHRNGSRAYAIALQPDGRVIAGGGASVGLALARYLGDASQPDFGISIIPSTTTVSRGDKGSIVVNTNRVGGFSDTVTVNAPDSSGFKIRLVPASGSTTGPNLTFNYKVKPKAKRGATQLTFTGTDSAGRARSAILTMLVE
jgi:uncharacterized delta-60 repeat protein